MGEPKITSSKVGSRLGRQMADTGSPGYRYRVGHVVTPHGVVGVYSQDGLTALVVVHGGREVRGQWPRTFSDRGLVSLCRRFADNPFALKGPSA